MEDQEEEVQALEKGGRVEAVDAEEGQGGAGDEDAELVDRLGLGEYISNGSKKGVRTPRAM